MQQTRFTNNDWPQLSVEPDGLGQWLVLSGGVGLGSFPDKRSAFNFARGRAVARASCSGGVPARVLVVGA
ncbi:hypothetical protein PBI_ATRAXA_2 [Arthrobacter phage Atraxa]|uniref:Uncharacterized protein n=1 Tax=Arthrobacter phage Atraxa TaxID=2419947 RepID=A0A3G2KD84_9CAUD|nr:hypothetical protein PP342_gp02 [Arthrobacter phage Atraxa]AYN56958.1 hypothetical protein PBI_ATRAXA_2 [Arthrobacter phage Atraxa]AYN59066.1 hypothetical protein PBI_SPUTNIK_2 [Arthrobacter phage Sputnik]